MNNTTTLAAALNRQLADNRMAQHAGERTLTAITAALDARPRGIRGISDDVWGAVSTATPIPSSAAVAARLYPIEQRAADRAILRAHGAGFLSSTFPWLQPTRTGWTPGTRNADMRAAADIRGAILLARIEESSLMRLHDELNRP